MDTENVTAMREHRRLLLREIAIAQAAKRLLRHRSEQRSIASRRLVWFSFPQVFVFLSHSMAFVASTYQYLSFVNDRGSELGSAFMAPLGGWCEAHGAVAEPWGVRLVS